MSTAQTVGTNGKATEPQVPPVTLEVLQAQLAELLAENKRLREVPQVYKGAQYGIVDPSDDYPNHAMKLSLPSGGKAIMGPRKKFLDIIDEVKSGRLEAFLGAHPEVK